MESHSVRNHWVYQYFVFGLMMAQWAETCRRIFNFFNIDYQYMLCHWRNKFTIWQRAFDLLKLASGYSWALIGTSNYKNQRSNYEDACLLWMWRTVLCLSRFQCLVSSFHLQDLLHRHQYCWTSGIRWTACSSRAIASSLSYHSPFDFVHFVNFS